MAPVAPMDHTKFHGGWKIVKIDLLTAEHGNTNGLEGVDFYLMDTGDIIWKIPPSIKVQPFFAETFDLYEDVGVKFHAIKFIGSRTGDKIEFIATLKQPDVMRLKYENVVVFTCERVWSVERAIEEPFSLHSALAEGFFSDLTIKADSGREFTVHKIILKYACPQLAWDQTPPPLSGTPYDVLHVILHFFYTECLPEDITEETAKKVLVAAQKLPGFSRLANLCQLYLHNVDVKEQIMGYVNEMHACGDRLAQLFSTQTTMADGSLRRENFMAEPAKMVYAIKQAVRETAQAGVKFMLICELFTKRKSEMSKHERNEVMKYIKSRLPIFVKQLHNVLEAFRDQLTMKITPAQHQDVSTYLVPEMDTVLDLMSDVVEEGKNGVEHILSLQKAKEKTKHSPLDNLSKILKNAMHMKEMMQLKTAHERISVLFDSMLWRQEAFNSLHESDKIFSVSKNIEQLVEEFPQIMEKIEKLDQKVNEGFSMKNWKFVFKMGTSKVMWSLEKARTHREQFRPLINRIDKLIDREAFTMGLIQLGVLPATHGEGGAGSSSVGGASASAGMALLEAEGGAAAPMEGSQATPAYLTNQPHIVESLCTPPSSSESRLAKAMGELLKAGMETDMCFEIVSVTEEPSDIVVDHTQGQTVQSQASEKMETRTVLKAHCVVIAARCDWFRRALLSGMRESIDKKIEVHDTDPNLFHKFLVFLYSGQIELSPLSTDQIADMMSLSDRYELDTLKQICEAALKSRLDEDSVLFLLSLADQFNARTLREATLNYIMAHPLVVSSDVYEELPDHLKTEVTSLVQSTKKGDEMDPVSRYQGKEYDSSSDSSDENLSMPGVAQELKDIKGTKHRVDSDSSSSEEDAAQMVAMDRQRMVDCITQLKEVIGDDLSSHALEELARAADFDVNRAVNYFLNS